MGPEFASAAGAVDALLPELGAPKPAKRKPAESGTAEPSDGCVGYGCLRMEVTYACSRLACLRSEIRLEMLTLLA